MDFKKFTKITLQLPELIRHPSPPQPIPIETLLSYYNFNHNRYIINRNGEVGYIVNKYPLIVKYLYNNKEEQQNPTDFYREEEFDNLNEISFMKYIMKELEQNNMIYDLIYFDDELVKNEFSLGNLRKYNYIIKNVRINYILIKKFGHYISIYVIGDLETVHEIFKDIGLGYITYQWGILTNLYPGVLPKGWGSALLCLLFKIENQDKEIVLEALTSDAKKFYERLGFIENTKYPNPLNLKLNPNNRSLKRYCAEHSIDLGSLSYDLKIGDDLYQDLDLDEIINLI